MKLEVYQDAKKHWRWRLKAGNNRIVADSGEGYIRRIDCLRGFALVRRCCRIPFAIQKVIADA